MEKIINVTIAREDDIVNLVFHFESELKLNLSSSEAKPVEAFFQKLLHIVFRAYNSELQDTFKFQLEDKGEDLFHDVAEKYLLNLNSEIKSIYSSLDN